MKKSQEKTNISNSRNNNTKRHRIEFKEIIHIGLLFITFTVFCLFLGLYTGYVFQVDSEKNVLEKFHLIFFDGFFGALSIVLSFGLAIYGLHRYVVQENKESMQSTSQYLSNMNIAYIRNEDFTKIYRNLDIVYQCRPRKENRSNEKVQIDVSLFTREQYVDAVKYLMETTADTFSIISNYLSFFEVLYMLHKNESVRFEDLNDLFYYRFFLAVQCGIINKHIVAEDGNPQRKDYYENIRQLQAEWEVWRQKNGKKNKIKQYAQNFSREFIEEIFPQTEVAERMTKLFGNSK